jgi:energy-coupling factor transport system substrate-specific component
METIKQVEENQPVGKRKLSNYDLLMISVLSGLGGVISTYIGYLGNLLNRLVGVPFGAGQFVSGLHVFWIILVAGLIRRPGAATAAGLLKGIVELFTGSTHGIVIVFISLCQGLAVELVLFIMRKHNWATYAIAGGFAATSNVILFQLLYFSGAPIAYIGLISLMAFISGVIFAGSFGHSVLELLNQSKAFGRHKQANKTSPNQRIRLIVTGLFAVILSVGAIVYFVNIYEAPWGEKELTIAGKVENEISFNLEKYQAEYKTIRAELKGEYTYVPETDYTGVPITVMIKDAQPNEDATELTVVASDGYQVSFPLADVMIDEKMVLIKEDTQLRLIAGNYEGGYWVRQVVKLLIE